MVMESVACPDGSGQFCAGDQCCPGEPGQGSFVCPSARNTWRWQGICARGKKEGTDCLEHGCTAGCQVDYKVATCLDRFVWSVSAGESPTVGDVNASLAHVNRQCEGQCSCSREDVS
mmetsp:Transcript_8884/g.26932  ORF Transcript_8884/g.26932 Transcript_8884/m.26932 type:complete len:117 (-) Transcript_8884:84-434(-)